MASTSELKKVKLNITNIKSVLVDGKKAVDEKQKERENFLTKLEEERKQRRESDSNDREGKERGRERERERGRERQQCGKHR